MWPHTCINVPEVTNFKEFQEFISKTIGERVSTKYFPYKIYIMPNVDGKYGWVQIVGSHAFLDGISVLSAW